MLYQVQYRQGDDWLPYRQPVAAASIGWTRAQCTTTHPGCDVRVIEVRVEEPGESWDDVRRRRMEEGEGGDHDLPYIYQPPIDWSIRRAFSRLLARVQQGELEP